MNRPRTALVTGSNRGIGLEIARSLAGVENLSVIAAARRRRDAERTASDLGDAVEPAALDLSDPAAAEESVSIIDGQLGPVDILINNAGVMLPGRGIEASVDALQRCLAVNTVAPFALIRALAPGMQDRGWGRIVNVSSGWGSFHERFGGPLGYSISKAALNALTVTVADALDDRVKVNAVCPGWVRTRMGGSDAHRSPKEAADTPVWLATLPDDGPTGGFFRRREPIDW